MFLEGSETVISAILTSRVKSRVLNYDADLDVDPNFSQYSPQAPSIHIFNYFLVFSKKMFFENLTNIFSNWSD